MLLHDWFKGTGATDADVEYCRQTAQVIIPGYLHDLGISPRAFFLYFIYAAECQEGNGICWSSLSELSKEARMSRRSVIDARRELGHFGVIDVRRPKMMFGPGVKIQVSLRHPDGPPAAPWTSPRPDSPYEDRRHGTRRRKTKDS